MKAYWHQSANFGDCLTPYLIKKITGQDAVHTDPAPDVICLTGSLLGYNLNGATVWGLGTAWRECPIVPAKYVAVRGPISRELVRKAGLGDPVMGDPGLLLPKHFNPSVEEKYDLGIICSWVDAEKVVKEYAHKNVHIINSMTPVEEVITRLLSCRTIVASCLHGLIAAVAYGKPVLPVKLSNNMVGDGTKFHDFLASIKATVPLMDLSQPQPWRKLMDWAKVLPIDLDMKAFEESWPLK